MNDMTFFERFIRVINIVLSSPFFIALLIIILLTIALLVFNVLVKKKWLKILVSVVYLGITIYIFIRYWDSAFSLSDALVDKIFTALYFPNYITYICMLIISVILFIMTMINKKLTKFAKIGNTFSFLAIGFLFILILDTVTKYDINVYDKTEVYASDTLLVLIQTSMGIFGIWCLILLVDLTASTIVKHLKKKGEKAPKEAIQEELSNINVDVDKKIVPNEPLIDPAISSKQSLVNPSLPKDDPSPVVASTIDRHKKEAKQEHDKDLDSTIVDFTVLSDEKFYKYYKAKEEEDKYEEYQEIIAHDDKFD